MAELFDKEGNPLEAFDIDGNPIDEALTPDEADTRIQEAKDEAQGGFETKTQELQEQLTEKEDALKKAEEDLEKEKEKDKNFGKLRGTTEEKEKEAEALKEEVKGLKDEVEGIKTAAKAQPISVMIKEAAGDDEELEKKIKFHYDNFSVPEEDTEEKQKERVKNAHILAGGGAASSLGGNAISSGAGAAPGIKESESGKEKLTDPGASEVGEKLGISKEEQKKNKLI